MIEDKIQEISQPAYDAQSVRSLPVYRCVVLLGHEFQNFPHFVSKVFKIRNAQTMDRNIVKWLL